MTNTALSPKPPPLSGKSFFHQAATAAVFAPLIAVGVNLLATVGGQGFDPQMQRNIALSVGLAASCLMLFGLILAVIALCGIPKHGRKNILGKALLGMFIPLFFIVMLIIPAFLRAHQNALRH
jgi:hypothetical protein